MARTLKFPKRPKPTTKKSQPAHRWQYVVLALIGVALVFALGFGVGRMVGPSAGKKNGSFDLTNFYKAKQLIEQQAVGKVNEGDLATGATKGLVSGLKDPYSVYLTKDEAKDLQTALEGKVTGIGIEVGLRDEQVTVIAPVAGSPAEKAGIKAGDQIVGVNGKPTDGQTVDEVAKQIRGDAGSEVIVDVRTPGQPTPRTLKITRAEISSPSVKLTYEGNVAVITISRFDQNTKQQLDAAVTDIQSKKPRGIVLDLRGNPGGYLEGAIDVSSVFMKDGTVVKEKFKNKTEERSVTAGDGRLADYPLVILADKGSASASEITAGALRDNRQIPIVGEQTYGKGSVQELMDMAGGAILKLTIAEWLTPKGTSISKEGLKPDQEVSSDDPAAQLQAAIGKLQ